ncbi:MAG: glycosyltransferase [Chitinophagales bacterium]|nr:glycosyltransferase [Bacteroidota bacterium]MCB9043305.1 glycosyltransferase [Chitinophagales bacterium]
MQKNILFLINSLEMGGAEKATINLAEKLQPNKNSHIYFVILKNKTQVPLKENFSYHFFSQKQNPSFLYSILQVPFLAYKLIKYCRKHDIDTIFAVLSKAQFVAVLSKFLGNKSQIICSEHTVLSKWQNKQLLYPFLQKISIGFSYRNADKVHCVSESIARDLEQNFQISPAKISVIPNIIDFRHISTAQNEAINFDFPPKTLRLISVGSLKTIKNQSLTLRALAQVSNKNFTLLILGDGPDRKMLEKLCEELQLSDKVHFLGNQANPFPYLKAADIFLLSSFLEGLPNVIIEALLCRCAVLATDCESGPREILAPESPPEMRLKEGFEIVPYGILSAVNDINAYVNALETLFDNPQLMCEFQEKATNCVQAFSPEKIIQQYRQLFEME